MKLACKYAIVQFMPYPETGEFANAGIVLACPKTGFFSYRLERKKYARITNFFDELHASVYKESIGNFECELVRVAQELTASGSSPNLVRNMFDYLVHPREAIVRFGAPRAIMVDIPEVAIEQLFDYYVGRNFVTKEYQEEVITKRVSSIINALDLDIPFREERIGNEDFSVKFPLVQLEKSGAPLKLIKPLFLGHDEPSKIYNHGDGWIAKLRRLRMLRVLPKRMLFTLTHPDPSYERRAAAAYNIKQELALMDIEVIDTNDEKKIIDFAAT